MPLGSCREAAVGRRQAVLWWSIGVVVRWSGNEARKKTCKSLGNRKKEM